MWGLGGCANLIRGGMDVIRVKRHQLVMRFTTGALILPALLTSFSVGAAEPSSSASRSLNANGSTSMNYSTRLNDIGATFGLDMSAPAASVAPHPVQGTEKVSGTAYARVPLSNLPDWLMWQKGSVNVVVNPTAEESRIGTNFSRTWTVTEGLKATLADSYAVSHSLSGNSSWKTDKSLSVKLEDTGTTLSVATTATDSAQNLQHRISARQDIFGNLNITTSVTDNGSTLDKSIRAGLSHRW